jgi:WD40 repeat protein
MRVLSGHTGLIHRLAFRPDGRLLATASEDGSVRLWDLTAGEEAGRFCSDQNHALAVAFSPDGMVLAAGFGRDIGLVGLWHVDTLARLDIWAAHGRATRSLAFTPGGERLITGGRPGPAGWGSATVWDLAAGPATVATQLGGVGGQEFARLAVSPDGLRVVGVGRYPHVSVWDWKPSRWRYHERPVGGASEGADAAIDPSGEWFAGAFDTTLLLCPVATLQSKPMRWSLDGDRPCAYRAVAFSPDGRTLASADEDGQILFWDLPTRTVRERFDWRLGDVVSVAFAPDGLTVAAGGADGTVLLWDLNE